MAISVGDAVLKMGVDTRDLDKSMQSLGARIKKHQKAIGLGMVALGGAVLAAGALSIKTFAEMGDEVQKMALRTGFSTIALSELRHAAEISGASLSTLEKGVKRMSGTILDAQDGLETYIRAFEHIGIKVSELRHLNPEQQFLKIAEAIAEVEDPTKRAAIAQDIFGRAGTELLPLFAAGKEGLADLREEAHRLGIVFDQEAANKAAELTDALHRSKEATAGLKMQIAEKLIPALMPLIERITEIISRVTQWADQHPELFSRITLITGAVAALLIPLGMFLIALPTLSSALAMLHAKTLIVTAAQWLWNVAMMANPIGLIILLAVALGAAIATLAIHWKEVANEMARVFNVVKDAVAGVVDYVTHLIAMIGQLWDMLMRMVMWKPFMPFPAGVQTRTAMREAALGAGRGMPSPKLAALQNEGIAMRPMLASIAEKEPEAVLSIDRLAKMVGVGSGKIVNIFVELDGRTIAKAIGQPLVDEIRLRTGVIS